MSESLPWRRRAPRDGRGPAPGLSLAACHASGCRHVQCRRAAAAAEQLARPQTGRQLQALAAMAHSCTFLARRLGVAEHVVRQAQLGKLYPLPDHLAEAVGRLYRELQGVRGTSPQSARLAARRGWLASVDATGTRRRLRALARMGWSCEALAARLPDDGDAAAGEALVRCIRDSRRQAWIPAPLAATVATLYDELWDVLGGSEDAIHVAMARGWAPPMAWDDNPGDPHYIDDPQAPVSAWKRPRYTSAAELAEDIREIMAVGGYPAPELAAGRLGITRAALDKRLIRAWAAS